MGCVSGVSLTVKRGITGGLLQMRGVPQLLVFGALGVCVDSWLMPGQCISSAKHLRFRHTTEACIDF